MKRQRQEAIIQKLKTGAVTSQRQLVEMLSREGFHVSQTTVSRDLEEMGLAKGRDANGRLRYGKAGSLHGSADPTRSLRRMAPDFLLTAEPTGNLVVIRTTVGNAQGLAAALDAAGLSGVAGTVAGDDTILVVCSSGISSKQLRRQILKFTV
ncbi:MAG: arginine repressor [Actinobacteria bacterium]|nr:arginine repressor [Actinomycetota bacterium]